MSESEVFIEYLETYIKLDIIHYHVIDTGVRTQEEKEEMRLLREKVTELEIKLGIRYEGDNHV